MECSTCGWVGDVRKCVDRDDRTRMGDGIIRTYLECVVCGNTLWRIEYTNIGCVWG